MFIDRSCELSCVVGLKSRNAYAYKIVSKRRNENFIPLTRIFYLQNLFKHLNFFKPKKIEIFSENILFYAYFYAQMDHYWQVFNLIFLVILTKSERDSENDECVNKKIVIKVTSARG